MIIEDKCSLEVHEPYESNFSSADVFKVISVDNHADQINIYVQSRQTHTIEYVTHAITLFIIGCIFQRKHSIAFSRHLIYAIFYLVAEWLLYFNLIAEANNKT